MSLSRGFFYLMQGFMGLGLVVGIAAVGVIAFRTVVERRQQIGMLRAIGFSRGQVALSFMLESSFVTILGILTGLGLGTLLSYFLLTSKSMSDMGLKGFYIPWLEIIPICAIAYVAALVMTFVPSRQAASIPIAEALRYGSSRRQARPLATTAGSRQDARMREATPADNDALIDLELRSPLDLGDRTISFDRSPNFFAHQEMQAHGRVLVAEDEGQLVAVVAGAGTTSWSTVAGAGCSMFTRDARCRSTDAGTSLRIWSSATTSSRGRKEWRRPTG